MKNSYRASLIDDMVWSYSRLNTFGMCKNQWHLKYLEYADAEEEAMFFLQYGLFVHDILARYFKGEITAPETVRIYLCGFSKNVYARPPNQKIYQTYYQDGLNYFRSIPPILGRVLAVEKEIDFNLSFDGVDLSCTGFIDLCYEDENGITIMDHKSRILKPLSNRKKPTLSDLKTMEYFRQLYLYGCAWEQETGKAPDRLQINSFRGNTVITEPFTESRRDETLEWAVKTYRAIRSETRFAPDIDWFKCSFLCSMHRYCDLYDSI